MLHQSPQRSPGRLPDAPPRLGRRTVSIGMIVTLLLHLLALWMILAYQRDIVLSPPGGHDTETTLLMIPNTPDRKPDAHRAKGVETPPPPPPATAPRPKPRIKRQPSRPVRSLPTAPANPDAISAPLADAPLARAVEATPAPQTAPAPEEDFSSRLAARQKQRAEAETQERERQDQRGSPAQQDAERGKQAALANIASALHKAGIEKENGGGLFKLENLGTHNAEFLFRGWKKEASRNWSQMIQVEQGGEADIRIAVVKKMIDIIRQHTQEDFTWESHRLGRTISLSARAEDTVGLQQFLLREFFPDFSVPQR